VSSQVDQLGIDDFVSALGELALRAGELRFNVPLSSLGRWRIGGCADVVITPQSRDSLARVLGAIADSGLPHAIIGHGTNLLFDDAGYRGIIVQIGPSFSQFRLLDPETVEVGAGLWVPCFVRRVIAHGLGGATHAIGIPGTVGGLIAMNGGSQRHGIGENIIDVDVIDRAGAVHRLSHSDLNFAYRSSSIHRSGVTVVSARFRFAAADRDLLRREAIDILRQRRAKFPKARANCGSVFVSDPKLYDRIGPAGKAIESVGLKGLRHGGAEISAEHANFIVNNGGASSRDVLALIRRAREAVLAATGIAMATEVRYLEPSGALVSADLASEGATR